MYTFSFLPVKGRQVCTTIFPSLPRGEVRGHVYLLLLLGMVASRMVACPSLSRLGKCEACPPVPH